MLLFFNIQENLGNYYGCLHIHEVPPQHDNGELGFLNDLHDWHLCAFCCGISASLYCLIWRPVQNLEPGS